MGFVRAFIAFIIFPLLGIFFAIIAEFMWNSQGWGGVFLGSGISLGMTMWAIFLAFLVSGLLLGVLEAIRKGQPWG